MLLDPDSGFEEVGDYNLLITLALAHDPVSGLQFLGCGARGSAGQLPIEEAIAEHAYVGDTASIHGLLLIK